MLSEGATMSPLFLHPRSKLLFVYYSCEHHGPDVEQREPDRALILPAF